MWTPENRPKYDRSKLRYPSGTARRRRRDGRRRRPAPVFDGRALRAGGVGPRGRHALHGLAGRGPGRRVRACITSDGVLLRARDMAGAGGGAASADMEAVRVDYGGQDPARFRPPPGFQTMRMPGQMPGQMMPPGAGPPGMQGGGGGRPPPR